MTLDAYLRNHGETEAEFAERAGIGRATVFRIKKSGARSIAIIRKVVAACGGQVSWDDLVAMAPKKRKGKAA